MTRKIFIICCLVLNVVVMAGDDDGAKKKKLTGDNMPVSTFLKYLRYPQVINSWMKMKGVIINKSGGKKYKMPIELRGRFRERSWRMQIIIDNCERWYVRQNFDDGQFGTSKIQQKKSAPNKKSLSDFMIRPEDVTLSFLYWSFVKEEKSDTVSRQRCRVLRLKHEISGEQVLIWASTKYFFPMKVQWIRAGDKKHYRELIFKGAVAFKPKSRPDLKMNVISEVKIIGDGWKTIMTFDKPNGDAVTDDALPPVDLFIRDEEREESDKEIESAKLPNPTSNPKP